MTLDLSAQYIKDYYGNNYNVSATAYPGYYSQGGVISSSQGGVLSNTSYSINTPGLFTLGPAVIDQLMKEMVTRHTGDGPLVICVDNDFTSTQVRELAQTLIDNNIKGVIISGARAGTGKTIHRDLKEQYQLIDTLGRIAMVWQEHKDLNFTDLIKWYKGEDMDDDHFAAAIDVYVKKIYGA